MLNGAGIVLDPGGPSYVMATCGCGNAGAQALLRSYAERGHMLWLGCAMSICGHEFALSIRKGTQFNVGEHWHGVPAGQPRIRR